MVLPRLMLLWEQDQISNIRLGYCNRLCNVLLLPDAIMAHQLEPAAVSSCKNISKRLLAHRNPAKGTWGKGRLRRLDLHPQNRH